MTRMRAIWCCIWFGLMPWQVYQPICHYRSGYWRHAWLNVRQAWVWITFAESASARKFEREVNPSWAMVAKKMFRFTYPLADSPFYAHKYNDQGQTRREKGHE